MRVRKPAETLGFWEVVGESLLLRRLTRERFYFAIPETRRGRPARIALGDPMPEMVKLLPEPGELGT